MQRAIITFVKVAQQQQKFNLDLIHSDRKLTQ